MCNNVFMPVLGALYNIQNKGIEVGIPTSNYVVRVVNSDTKTFGIEGDDRIFFIDYYAWERLEAESTCKNCGNMRKNVGGFLECREESPFAGDSGEGFWPTVMVFDWCSKHENLTVVGGA